MKVKDRSRFSIDVLRDLACEAVFARREDYRRGGQVQIPEQAAYIATLKARQRQKRNFTKLLG